MCLGTAYEMDTKLTELYSGDSCLKQILQKEEADVSLPHRLLLVCSAIPMRTAAPALGLTRIREMANRS